MVKGKIVADMVVDCVAGDSGKGKISHYLLSHGDYTHCLRFGGGANAGHTIYHNGEKFVTHGIPAGVFFGIKSIIGSGCVVNVEQFLSEIKELNEKGIKTDGLVYIAKNAHVVTTEHLTEDGLDAIIGTTKRGIGPAYRAKYGRTGQRAEQIPELQAYLIDLYDEFYNSGNKDVIILCEGAQGFQLDIDWGDYPYVTSSHCTTAGALLNGIPPQAVRKVFGVAKAYDTYVGAKRFHGTGTIFDQLQKVGNEFGATTGRRRQCNWLNVSSLLKATKMNGVTDLVINKMDVMREVGVWNLRASDTEGIILRLGNEQSWKQYIKRYLGDGVNVIFSESAETI
jgi:adenylosuccinate synthase